MPTVNIPNYHQKLASSEPKRITEIIPGRLGAPSRKQAVIIPPLNTQIDFSAVPRYVSEGKGLAASSSLPEEFSWRPTGNGYTNPDDGESFGFHRRKMMAVEADEKRALGEGFHLQNLLASENGGYYGSIAQHKRLQGRGRRPDPGLRHRRKGYLGLQSRTLGENYNNNRTENRKYISPVLNQAMCGSCWAVSSASAVGDVFAVAGKLPTDSNGNPVAPQPSATYVLSCYPQSQCGGGNPSELLQKIAESGIASQHCSDYSWCLSNDDCNGSATGHFKTESEQISAFNALIPGCGCYDNSVGHVKFYIDNVSGMDLDSTKDFTNTLKSHIFTHGTVIGGFLVYSNFMSGKFTSDDNPEGVYFENVNYSGSGDYFLDSEPSFDGAHAVSIIGWGVAKNTKYKYIDPDTKKTKSGVGDVPYWHVRNSWTDSWGDGGYFKMAMWPYNQKSQFDKVVTVNTGSGRTQTGGVVAFTAKTFESDQDLGPASNVPKKLLKSGKYYSTELGGGSDPSPTNNDSSGGSNGSNISPWVWVGVSVGVVILVLLVWWIIRRR